MNSRKMQRYKTQSQKQLPWGIVKKFVRKNFAKFKGKRACRSLFFTKVAGLIKKETLTKVFSNEFCEIFKKTLFKKNTSTGLSLKAM